MKSPKCLDFRHQNCDKIVSQCIFSGVFDSFPIAETLAGRAAEGAKPPAARREGGGAEPTAGPMSDGRMGIESPS
jgi:hypothetical protein